MVSTVNSEPLLRRPVRCHWSSLDRGVDGRDLRRPLDQLGADLARVLQAVVLLDGSRVLVPVLEGGVVLVEHQPQPLGEELVHVAHVAGVLQTRPHVRGRTYGEVGVGQHVVPAAGVLVDEVGQALAGHLPRVETALPGTARR